MRCRSFHPWRDASVRPCARPSTILKRCSPTGPRIRARRASYRQTRAPTGSASDDWGTIYSEAVEVARALGGAPGTPGAARSPAPPCEHGLTGWRSVHMLRARRERRRRHAGRKAPRSMAGPCGARTSRRGRVVTRVARVGVWCTAGLVASWVAFRAAGIEVGAGPFLLYCIVLFATGLTMDFLERRAADPRTAAGVVAAGTTIMF